MSCDHFPTPDTMYVEYVNLSGTAAPCPEYVRRARQALAAAQTVTVTNEDGTTEDRPPTDAERAALNAMLDQMEEQKP